MNSKKEVSKLSDRIDTALAKESRKNTLKSKNQSLLGSFYKLATELLAGLLIGAGIGWTIDQWVNTTPLFMVIFFILGGLAGIYNLWRIVTGKGLKIGFFNKK